MKDLDIINNFKKGKSITFITNQFYRIKNANLRENYYSNGSFIIPKKNLTKLQCRKYVENVILNYLKNHKVNNGQS